jgi:hypothetical protein
LEQGGVNSPKTIELGSLVSLRTIDCSRDIRPSSLVSLLDGEVRRVGCSIVATEPEIISTSQVAVSMGTSKQSDGFRAS